MAAFKINAEIFVEGSDIVDRKSAWQVVEDMLGAYETPKDIAVHIHITHTEKLLGKIMEYETKTI